VDILDREHQRAVLGERLEELSPGGERLGATIAAAELRGPNSDERAEVRLEPWVADHLTELPLHLLPRVALEDPEVCLHDLAERPEGDPVAV
jgi:hypothetical protein